MEEKEQALRKAARRGEEDRVKQLLAEGVNVNAADNSRRTALHHASENGHTGIVQALLTAGATVDARDSGNETPLHAAAKKGHPECVRVLLRAGANTVNRNSDNKTAEELAVQEDVQQVLQLFKALQPKVVDDLLTIDLRDKGLTSVPAEVFDNRDVQRLVLSNNRLTSIPEEIGQLQKLRRLELDNNLLTQLPQAITTLPNLQVMHIVLSLNKLETLPDGFSRLKQLWDLYIQYNAFKEIPEVCSLLQLRPRQLRPQGRLKTAIQVHNRTRPLMPRLQQTEQDGGLTHVETSRMRGLNQPNIGVAQINKNHRTVELSSQPRSGIIATKFSNKSMACNKTVLRRSRRAIIPAIPIQFTEYKITTNTST
ncbi:uncharacterized protein LOC144914917 isoform X2 [Branchiostoma floridae x Branchiostoma belcheri]